jgi:hypothetical protein
MRLFGLNSRRSKTLLLAVGQLVLIAFVFQVAAFDHWDVDVGQDVAGVTGSSAHSALHGEHCHGAAAGCADAGSGFAQASPDQAIRLPAQTPTLATASVLWTESLTQTYISEIAEPPRNGAWG